ncbi:type I restriction enzyme S subunit [Pseudomonas sp. ADAK2 TE3594]
MTNELPNGWAETSLGQLATYINGKGFKKTEWQESGLPIIRIQNLNNPNLPFNYADEDHEEKYKVLSGDLLFAWSASLGVYIWNGDDAWLNQHIFRVEPDLRLVSKNYLYYAIKNSIEELYKKTHGMGMVHLTKGQFERHEIWLPPLNEQIRITNKLDSLFAKVDVAQTSLKNIPSLLKRFRQAVLAAATSGRLSGDSVAESIEYYEALEEQIFSTPKSAKLVSLSEDEIADAKNLFGGPEWGRWRLFSLEQLVDPERGIPYGIIQTGEAQDEGVPTVRCGDVKPLIVLEESLKKVAPEIESKYSRTRLKGGEVLLAIRGTVGNAAVASKGLAGRNANISREVAMIPIIPNIDPKFIAMLLQSPGGFRCLAEKVRGVAQKGINLADVKRFVTPLPSLNEQKEIVNRVESLFALADVVEKQYGETKKRIDRLMPSLLAKAFCGQLVSQDPNDESANLLLERIKQQPAAKSTSITSRNQKKTSKYSSVKDESSQVGGRVLNLLQYNNSELTAQKIMDSLSEKTFAQVDILFTELKQLLERRQIIKIGVGEFCAFKARYK